MQMLGLAHSLTTFILGLFWLLALVPTIPLWGRLAFVGVPTLLLSNAFMFHRRRDSSVESHPNTIGFGAIVLFFGWVPFLLTSAVVFFVAFIALSNGHFVAGFGLACITLALGWYQRFVLLSVRARHPNYMWLAKSGIRFRTVGGTRMDQANLTGASFRDADMRGCHLIGAEMTCVRWDGARGLDEVRLNDRVLIQGEARDLLTTRNGKGLNFVLMDLHSTDLSDIDLRGANLRQANLAGAVLTNANLTGACIEGWNISATTKLNSVICTYVFLLEDYDEWGSRKRRPADPERNFEPGEFELLYTEAIRQLEILLKHSLPLTIVAEMVVHLEEKHPGLRLVKIENRGNRPLLGFTSPQEADEAAIERSARRLAEEKYELLQSSYRDIKQIALAATTAGVKVQLGGKSVEDKSIHGNVTITGSQVGSVTGDLQRVTQTLTAAGGEQAGLAAAVENLALSIVESRVLTSPEKHEASAQVATVVTAAVEVAKDASWATAAGKAIERLTALLAKSPDLTKLVEAVEKAWQSVARTIG